MDTTDAHNVHEHQTTLVVVRTTRRVLMMARRPPSSRKRRRRLMAATARRSIRSRKRQRRATPIYTARQYATLSLAEREARDEALEVLALMRREGLSFRKAVRRVGTSGGTAWRYVGAELRRTRGGRIVATRGDRLFRRMRVLTTDGLQTIDLRGSRVASLVAKHISAAKHYLSTGDESGLGPFTDVFPGGKRLMTDPMAIEREARRGELDFEDIYDLST